MKGGRKSGSPSEAEGQEAAHIGVLRALEEVGLKLEIVAGTSIGALVGGIYSAGKIDELTEIALGLDWKKAARYFMEVSFPRSGLIEGARINEFLWKWWGIEA